MIVKYEPNKVGKSIVSVTFFIAGANATAKIKKSLMNK